MYLKWMRNLLIILIFFFSLIYAKEHPALAIYQYRNKIQKQNYIVPYILTIYAIDMLNKHTNKNSDVEKVNKLWINIGSQ
jgi:hypothetical protein